MPHLMDDGVDVFMSSYRVDDLLSPPKSVIIGEWGFVKLSVVTIVAMLRTEIVENALRDDGEPSAEATANTRQCV